MSSRFSVALIPAEAGSAIVEAFNHTPFLGCLARADQVFSAYSRYEDGWLIMVGKGKYLHSERVDRVFLKDLVDGVASVTPNSPLKPCPEKKPPVVLEYKMPDSANPMAKR